MKAADRFHVAPWALLERGVVWLEMAVALINAEARAAHETNVRQARRQRMAQRMSGGRRS